MIEKMTTEKWKETVRIITDGEYESIGEYKNNKTPVDIIHIKCSTIFSPSPGNFKNNGTRCPKCSIKKVISGIKQGSNRRKITTSIYKEDVLELVGNEYSILGEYKNCKTKILIKHNTCNNEFLMTPDSFRAGRRCPKCRNNEALSKRKMTKSEFDKKVKDILGNDYVIMSDNFESVHSYINVLHKKCNTVYSTMARHILYDGNLCPNCSHLSKGENKIYKFLTKHKIEFIHQYDELELYHIKKLSFDFAITEKGKLKKLIEYDGRFHYTPWDDSEYSINKFNEQVKRDAIKNNYCNDNGIELIRIPYWEFNRIEDILNQSFNIRSTTIEK